MNCFRPSIVPLMAFIFIATAELVRANDFTEVFRWKHLDFFEYNEPDGFSDFAFPDQIEHNRNTFAYVPHDNIPMGVAHSNGYLFITVPRRRPGIPSTLNYINIRRVKHGSPKLSAYPSIEANSLSKNFSPNPRKIVSVYRTSVDACSRLWFVDTGMLEYPGNRIQVQRPSIWVINLQNDQVVRRYDIPVSIAETGQGMASITVDVTQSACGEAFAYIPDLINNRIHVYSYAANHMWSFSHNYFHFDPLGGDLSIGGQNFRWDDGIFSITLIPSPIYGTKIALFHAMASTYEFGVLTDVLRNETNSQRSYHGNDFFLIGDRGKGRQSSMHAYDPRTEVVFYAEIQRNGVGCWSTKSAFATENHGKVYQNDNHMIYPSDLTVDSEGTIWVMANSLPIYIYSSLDPNSYNFHIWKQSAHGAINGTICGRKFNFNQF